MGLLSSAMKTELAKAQPSTFMVFRLDLTKGGKFPSLGVKQMAKSYVASATNGLYEGRVLTFGSMKRSGGDRQKNLQPVQTTVTIRDTDRVFYNAVASGADLRGCQAIRYYASDNVAPANWFTEFDGILDGWEIVGDGEWVLRLRSNDAALSAAIQRPTITDADWPNLPVGSEGKKVPIVTGHFHSGGLSSRGALPTIYVDNVTAATFTFVASYGLMSLITDVYKDGVRQTSGWGWFLRYIAGFPWTVIIFTSDPGSSVITFDGMGLDTVGNLTGTALLTGDAILGFLLANFFYADGRGDPTNLNLGGGTPLWYPASHAPIDTTLFTAWATSAGFRLVNGAPVRAASFIGDTDVTGYQLIQYMGHTFQADLFWTNAGKLGIRDDNPCTSDLTGLPWFQESEVFSFQPRFPADDIVKRVNTSILNFPAESQPRRRMVVFDNRFTLEGSEDLSYEWMTEAM